MAFVDCLKIFNLFNSIKPKFPSVKFSDGGVFEPKDIYPPPDFADKSASAIKKSTDEKFLKDHAGKPMLSLLPWAEIEQVAQVADYGAVKHSRDNWKLGEPDDYLSAALRHVSLRIQQQKIDESGLPHLAHAVCSLLFVMWMDNNRQQAPVKTTGIRIDWSAPDASMYPEKKEKL